MNPSFLSLKILAVCCVILFFKMYAIGVFQALTRVKSEEFTNPEDAKFFAKKDPVPVDHHMAQRGANAFRNDLENIPAFFMLALIYTLLGCWEQGSMIYFSIFTIARIGHTISYLKGLQPWRTVGFAVGSLINMILCGHILYKIFA